MKKLKIELEIPFVDFFMDYHDIRDLEERLNNLFCDVKIKSYEINLEEEFSLYSEEGNYCAVFYVGKKPNKKDIKALLIERGCGELL